MRKMLAIAIVTLFLAPLGTRAGEPGEDGKNGGEAVPVTDVVLFSSGVGYFGRSGQVEGDQKLELVFKAEQINDLLKSLVVLDLGGGRVSTVSYASQDPTGKALQAFGLDLAGNPSLGSLLIQLRGVEVSVTTPEGARQGTVLGVETRVIKTEGGDIISHQVLNLVTEKGIKSYRVDELRDVNILNPNLKDDLTKALAILARSRDRRKRSLAISFVGKGQRDVKVAYILEAPVWKTSYRLLLAKNPLLQGWAVVENTTDSDWKDVNLSLVSGRPISFIQDLYTPLYLPRPVVRPKLYAGLMPKSYDEAMIMGEREEEKSLAYGKEAAKSRRYREEAGARAPMPESPGRGWAGGKGGLADIGADRLGDLAAATMLSAASGQEAGELFRYSVANPVSIARQSSAMLPIVAEGVTGEKLSIYNANTHPKHPFSGFKMKNTTALALLAGPVTVFDDGVYAGDAQLPNLQPGEERLLSYGLDLSCSVEAQSEGKPQELVSAKIVHGALYTQYKHFQQTDYTLKNKKEAAKAVLVEHPYQHGWTLLEPKKFEERAESLYRFRVALKPGATEKLTVRTERVQSQTFALTNVDSNFIGVYLRSDKVSPKVKAALEKLIVLKKELNLLARERQNFEGQLRDLHTEQNRIRSNLHSVPRTSDLYARYLKKMGDQEDKIEALQVKIAEKRDGQHAKQTETNNYLTNLDVE